MKHIMTLARRSGAAVFAIVVMCCTALLAQTQAPVPQITGPVNESQVVTLKGNTLPALATMTDRGIAPSTMLLDNITLVLQRSPEQQRALARYLADQNNPNSPNYHRWLSPRQYGEQFGVAKEDIAKITSWLQGHGFRINSIANGRNLIVFSGTHAQLQAAFQTQIHSYESEGKKYWANSSDPKIPAALAPAVAGVLSLNNFPLEPAHTPPAVIRKGEKGRWQMVRRPDVQRNLGIPTNNTVRPQFNTDVYGSGVFAISPYDFATMYNVKPLWDEGIDGTGQTIAVVARSDIDPADVDYFRSTFGLPEKKLNIIYAGENPGQTLDGNESEATLDVQWAGAVAKNATIDLVIAGSTSVTDGVDIAALYILNNDLAPFMNVSYGLCESRAGAGKNLFYNEIWQQAAAQGITVTVASGDAGSATCDQGQFSAQYGLSVSSLSSTAYTVAIGGTDLYASALSPELYWNPTNDPTTLESLKSYVPETPWNDSCGNPQVLSFLQTYLGVQDATTEDLCNDPDHMWDFLTTAAGSGGPSRCALFEEDGTTCAGGNPRPAWQSGIPGLTPEDTRSVPDVSLFAGDGLWGSFYVFCQSDALAGGCDVNTNVQGAGGTSFGSPAFAGILALAAQKTGTRLGNPNYLLYKLAAGQYADPDKLNSCKSGNVANDNACIFYDVTDGSNAVPCLQGTLDCMIANPAYYFGVLPGYDAHEGYDYATGLGAVNAYNLVHAWNTASAAMLPTSTELAITGDTSVTYGSLIDVSVDVSPVAPATGIPTGDVAFVSDSTVPGNIAVGTAQTLVDGHVTAQLGGLPAGTYNLYARYGGDAAFSTSASEGVQITVARAATTGIVNSNRTSLNYDQGVVLTATLSSVGSGVVPTGTVTFVNSTSGVTLGTGVLEQDSVTTSSASINLLARHALITGTNNIVVEYPGDANYLPLTAEAATVSYQGPFVLGLGASTVTFAANSTASVDVKLIPQGTAYIDPAKLSFACPTALPIGLVCSFSAPVKNPDRSVTSTLTIKAGSPLVAAASVSASRRRAAVGWFGTGILFCIASLAIVIVPGRRPRRWDALAVFVVGVMLFNIGCGGNGIAETPASVPTTTSLTTSSTSISWGSDVNLTAQVNASTGSATPSGTVTFYDGTTVLGTAPVANGTAAYSTRALTVGTHTLTATYSGDSAYLTSSSTGASVNVTFTATIAVAATDEAQNASSADLTVNIR